MKSIVRHSVPFHDCDVMNIVWHGNYVKYLELGRTALAVKMALDWPDVKSLGISMPVVFCQIDYRKSLSYGDEFLIEASWEDFNSPSVVINYRLVSVDSKNVYARGVTKQVYVDVTSNQLYFEVPPKIGAILKNLDLN